MDYLNFYDYDSFICAVIKQCYNIRNDEDSIAIIAKYDDAQKIIMELVKNNFILKEISALESPEYNGYNDEFIISICNFDGDYEIWCEPMKRDGMYIDSESMAAFILDDCSSKVISHCDAKYKYEIHIGEEEIDNCSPLPCSRCDENDMSDLHSFSVSKSSDNGYCCFSFYTSENLSKTDIDDILKNLKWD